MQAITAAVDFSSGEIAVVKLENAGKRYGTGSDILCDVSLSIEPDGF